MEQSVISILLGLTILLFFYQIIRANAVARKRRLCVDYEIQHYKSTDEPLQNYTYIRTRSLCMVQCVRHSDCWAFNHHPDSATCILLPAAGCMTLDGQHGYLYIHLSDCHMLPVKEIHRHSDGGWRWVRTNSPASRNDLIKLPGQTIRYVSRVYHDGLYLPGWYHPAADTPFRAVSIEDNQVVKCPPESGEFLAFNNTWDYRWQSFLAGDRLPNNAAAITYLRNGTPLYFVKKSFPGTPGYDLTGFYDPVSEQNYFVNSGVMTASAVKILLVY